MEGAAGCWGERPLAVVGSVGAASCCTFCGGTPRNTLCRAAAKGSFSCCSHGSQGVHHPPCNLGLGEKNCARPKLQYREPLAHLVARGPIL